MKLSVEAVEAAFREANRRLRNDELSMSDTRAILTEALPHLTDDGATDTPPPVAAGAESATTTAAPSSPHLREELKKLRMYCGLCMDEPNASEDEQMAYDDIAMRLAKILADHPGEGVTPFELETERISWHRKEGYEAGLAARGATPATGHRPTCGTTYGESCDGYCPTPPIDREALVALANKWAGIYTVAGVFPEAVPWAEGVDGAYHASADELLDLIGEPK